MNASLDQLLQHPHLWRATAQRGFSGSGLSTGFATLDGALEQAGWPQDGLIELLSDQQGIGELRTLLPTPENPHAQRGPLGGLGSPAPFALRASAGSRRAPA